MAAISAKVIATFLSQERLYEDLYTSLVGV